MDKHSEKSIRERQTEQVRQTANVETDKLIPLSPEELRSIEGGACAFLRIPPYWRCW